MQPLACAQAIPPILTGPQVIYTLIYVVPFYLSSTTRPSRTLSRDAPSVIRARITSVSLTCVVCSNITVVILTWQGQATYGEAFHTMGYWPVGLPETGKCLLLTAILFSGPLYETLIDHRAWRDWLSMQPMKELFSEWTMLRNIIAGPLTEEVLFRSASVPLMLVARTSVTRTIFLSPIIFGLAHVHHFYEFRLTHPQVPAAAGVVRSLVQFAYTSLFGAYATFLYLRSGSLLAIFAVHAFCNVMGLPRFWGRVEPALSGDDVFRSGATEIDRKIRAAAAAARTPSVAWSVVYYVLLVGGAVGWWRNLGALTESANALVPIDI
ncbi:Uu.00g000880.m01.CDS01 [Anthostomella pinea]|uniref:intramembrane prenyl-peptidase Rce1 n=1 Tax=Anthostomella pinea TaxID=933095 RepID=A0AAI8VJC1_9PEZI|nr:Uu.00g000880.m01.CDS01 [Anthostomella pinea]